MLRGGECSAARKRDDDKDHHWRSDLDGTDHWPSLGIVLAFVVVTSSLPIATGPVRVARSLAALAPETEARN